MVYIYEGCMGGLYYTNEPLEYDDLYCETCGSTADLIGTASNKEEVIQLFDQECWNMDYIYEFVNSIDFE